MNLALHLDYTAGRFPDHEAVVDGDVRLTYRELRELAARVAGALEQLGLARGGRLAAVLQNTHETVTLYWAAQWLGASFVPLSWRASRADIEYCIEDSEAGLVATKEDGVIAIGETTFEELLAGEEHGGALDLDESAESLMLYTSGTTGRPKGVPRSHRADRSGGLSQVVQHGLHYGDRTLGVMPLYHTMGIHSLLAMSVVGGCFVAQRRWDASEALDLIERERITALYLAPTLYHDLVRHPRVASSGLSSVRALAYAGAAMTSALVEECVEAFAPRLFVNHYGSTEIYTFSVQRDQAAKPGCAGRAALNAKLRLGENGEVECHLGSDEAFTGYWRRPDADAKATHDGWYRTGDVGQIDADGDLWIVGRVDDMIISGGENVHPLEVEEVLSRHPGVAEVAVVGAPDERLGEHVVAVVVGTANEAELERHCLASEDLARFKRPREYRFVEELPKSPSGKILRRLLREEGVTA
jgi:2-furoate---CoA ligase